MPKVNKRVQAPTQQQDQEKVVQALAEVLWTHGDHETPHCRRQIVKAGIRMDELTPAMLHRAQEINRERLREGFRKTNADPNQKVKILIPGDSEFDPALNPNHPMRGAAKIKQEAEEREKAKKQEQTLAEKESTEKKAPTPQPKKEEEPKSNGGGVRGQRYEMFGHPVTAVFRWMGKQGWTIEQAMKAIAHFNIACSPSTVKIQVKAGSVGQRGEPAALTAEQAQQLEQAAGISSESRRSCSESPDEGKKKGAKKKKGG